MRDIKTYDAKDREFIYGNLICTYCGNTSAFHINLKLKHNIQEKNGQIEVNLDRVFTDKVLGVIKHNMDKLVERCYEGKKSFNCANCNESESVDYHERVLDYCYSMGCPGCFHCGEYIDKEQLLKLCQDCITDRKGNVDTDYCAFYCPHYDNGLEAVREHYHIDLENLKRELGY